MLTDLSFLNLGEAWPPESEIDRLKRYQENRMLFKGNHQIVYSKWVQLLRQDVNATMEIILNWHKRISTLWGDLLFGEPPIFKSPQQDVLDTLLEANSFVNQAYQVGLDVSRYGDGLFKVRFANGRAYIEGNPPTVWFPVVNVNNIKDVRAHVLAWERNEISRNIFGENKTTYLHVEIHERGLITSRVYRLKDGKIIAVESEEVTSTGVADFLVVPVHNLITTDSIHGLDDYQDIDTIIQELEIRFGQVSRILDKHADPNMYGPDSALEYDPATGEYVFKGGGNYFPVAEGEQPPGYVVWNGQLEMAFQQIETLMEQLYFLSETTATAFGNMKNGRADSGSALKRLLMTPLAHVNRLRLELDPKLKKVIKLANQLEIANGASNTAITKIDILWQDGLPKDDKEVTDIEVERYVAGLSSLERSIERLDGVQGSMLSEEITRIRKQQEELAQKLQMKQLIGNPNNRMKRTTSSQPET